MGISVFDIYTIINDVLESNPTMTIHKITPSMIHDGSVPNQKVQEILNQIIKNLPLHEDQIIIRENWNIMRFPRVNIANLVARINKTQMSSPIRFSILASIEELSKIITKKNLTIEGFAKEIHKILEEKTMKNPITEKEIKELLKYD
jgi:hypothetical protein